MLLQLMGLNPLVATLLVDMNFMVVRTDGNFWRNNLKTAGQQLWRSGNLTNVSDQFLVSVKYQPERLSVNKKTSHKHKNWHYWCVRCRLKETMKGFILTCPVAVPCVAGDGFQQKLMKGHLVWVWSLSWTAKSTQQNLVQRLATNTIWANSRTELCL